MAAAAAPSASAMADSLRVSVSSSDQGLASPPQHFVYDIASSLHQHHLRHDQVDVYLCLTCGFPVFRDDIIRESDLASLFCSDCFSLYDSRDSDDDIINSEGYYHDDDNIINSEGYYYDYDHDHGDSNNSNTINLNGSGMLSEFHFANEGDASMSEA